MTAPVRAEVRRFPREVYFLRRLLSIYLPMIVIGMAGYFYSYSFTLTVNGLSALTMLWVIGWVGIAAKDGSRS